MGSTTPDQIDRFIEWCDRVKAASMEAGISAMQVADAMDKLGRLNMRDIEHREIYAWQVRRYRREGWLVRSGWLLWRNAYRLHPRKVTVLSLHR